MKILFFTWLGSYIDDDLEYFFNKMGHDCRRIWNDHGDIPNRYEDDTFLEYFEGQVLSECFDVCFTTNYWPLVAEGCHRHGLPYISWSYDSPPNLPKTDTMEYDTNYIFFFSRDDVDDYKKKGIEHVYHMPLAVNTDRWAKVRANNLAFSSDISLVGKTYQSTLPTLKTRMSDYQKGYIDAIVASQQANDQAYIIRDAVTDKLIESINGNYATYPDNALTISAPQLIYSIATFVTHIDRLSLLKLLSTKFDTHLYTYDLPEEEYKLIPNVKIHGQVSYEEEMPQIFKLSKINLCPTFRGNCSGLPLRQLDVMGCGGFLLSSFRTELYEEFTDGVDTAMYYGLEDALKKADFYMTHDDIRLSIARKGYEKVKKYYTSEDRLNRMISLVRTVHG